MNNNTRRKQFLFALVYLLVALLAMFGLRAILPTGEDARVVPYSEFLSALRADQFVEIEIREEEIHGTLRTTKSSGSSHAPATVVTKRLPRIDESALLAELEEREIRFVGRIEPSPWWKSFFSFWLIPLGLMLLFYLAVVRQVPRGGPLNVSRSRAKVYDHSAQGRLTFADVAGVDEAKAELVEIVEFLRRPERYQRLGARIPKGVLLVGSPGTGKTLLAKAVAGEADVPFFPLSGSEFVEMFVGVGAARIRDLFEQAKERAPCIVFIDELDAIGKSRAGSNPIVAHDEREQTLNQLLVEMDGFDSKKGIIIMAATNRPEVLDPALLRAGRFDRQVVVDRPDLRGREDILRVHARRIALAQAVDLRAIAQRTPGMVGADLANVVNEAALAAGRRDSSQVESDDFEEAIDRLQLGLKKKGRLMGGDEKRRVAYHEAGHALVAMSLDRADPVHRVTIIPRSEGALGATLQLPTEERYLLTRAELLDRICVMMGGRASELLVLGDTSTGAQNDLERATDTARQMICRFGMSEKLGAVTVGRALGGRLLEGALGLGEARSFSEETARLVDAEIRNVVEQQGQRAAELLASQRDCLETIVAALIERETIERADLDRILNDRRRAGTERTDNADRLPLRPVPAGAA
jgi:cell division protease FtsH